MLRLALALAIALGLAGPAAAVEEILSFDVRIAVQPNGSIDVTETIRVTAEGDQIKRGIYRDFPVEHREDDGRVSLTTMDVVDVRRNDQSEPYSRFRMGSDVRIRIGQEDVFLPAPSEQVYTIRYHSDGQLREEGDVDELYWNVTGNDWAFPIRAASVEIELPDGTPIVQNAAYTGPRGATGSDYEVLQAEDGLYRARTTETLEPGEGFTVAIGWPPGAVEVPPVRYGVPGLDGYQDPPMMWNGQRVGPFASVVGTVIGFLVLLAAWIAVGRDPRGGAVYPRFEPPAGLSPAAIRYIKRQGFDPRCLTAAIIDMAVKGALRIVEKPSKSLFRDREYTLEPLGKDNRNLSVGEAAAYSKLFSRGTPLTLKGDRSNGGRMDSARSELKSKLWDEHYGASFRRNSLYTFVATALGAGAALLLIGITERWNALSLILWAVPAALAFVLVYGAGFVWFTIKDLRHGGRLPLRRVVTLLPFAIFWGTAFVVTDVFGAVGNSDFREMIEPTILAAGAAFGAAVGLFHFLMAAPTKAGRKLLDEIEGFEMYMATAEEDRLDMLHPPEKTPELFERLLPYAIALGLSHQWAEKFAGVLAAAAMPDWYQGTRRFDVDTMDREFSHAVLSTRTPPSRSSGGSSGGGSSGGGGGGGGGGGW